MFPASRKGGFFALYTMNLLLRVHENPADPVWSVIFLTFLAVAGATYYIYYVMNLAFSEYDGEDRPKH